MKISLFIVTILLWLTTTSTSAKRVGRCPPRPLRLCPLGGEDGVIGCKSDADCKGLEICCPDVCKNVCKNPVFDSQCAHVLCVIPNCSPPYVIDHEGPGCCPTCKLDCTGVTCLTCPEGLVEVYIPGATCCPQCKIPAS
ncbi:hypothetical protein HOLleu_41271 [Holothuria leucospilota]|uniref:WAP domain-containing protein n=1 Tax=Holothuria leucospilota TaxID=206669 RepID=A0A9Q0YGA2_HOLLE|nr:hypothetical protein HOLleu_41271 [Holothuria leucospilota]